MSIRVEAKTLDLALVRAAGQLGVTQDRMSYTVEEKSLGFLGMFGKKVVIKAWTKNDRGPMNSDRHQRPARRDENRRDENRKDENRRDEPRRDNRGPRPDHRQNAKNMDAGSRTSENKEAAPGSEKHQRSEKQGEGSNRNEDRRHQGRGRRPDRHQNRFQNEDRTASFGGENEEDDYERAPAPPITDEQMQQVKAELSAFAAELGRYMLGETVAVETEQVGERMIFDLKSDHLAAQITKNLKIAEAFEHLIRKKTRELKQDLPFRVFVDAMKTRLLREAELAELAKDFSNKVHESKQPMVLNYRRSYDRKIIHMALDQDDRVVTKSIGKGPNRKLMILPANHVAEGEASH